MSFEYTLRAVGPLDLRGPNGRIRLPGSKESALVAVLALTPGHMRTRTWLKTLLWGDRFEAQASASLRQALTRLRKTLNLHHRLLDADGDRVWLNGDLLRVEAEPQHHSDILLEGIDVQSEGFEDWLRAERAAWGSAPAVAAAPEPLPRPATQEPGRPRIIVAAPTGGEDLRPGTAGPGAATAMTDAIVACLLAYDVVDVFDLRDTDVPFVPRLAPSGSATGEILMRVREMPQAGVPFVSITATEPGTGRVISSFLREAPLGPGGDLCREALAANSAQAVDLLLHAAVTAVPIGAQKTSMALAVLELMTHRRRDYLAARAFLHRLFRERPSAVCAAWCAFADAVSIGERFGDASEPTLETCETFCREAVRLNPGNGLVRGIVGHVWSFVLRRPEVAAEHHALARSLAPNVALVADFAAMHALYSGRPDEAYALARRAVALGRLSPLRAYFEASVAMCASVTGRHEEAIRTGRSVLAEMPDLMPVMRHIGASLAALGEIGAAREHIHLTQQVDPEFLPGRIEEPDYPLPSPNSVDLVRHGFRLAGLRA